MNTTHPALLPLPVHAPQAQSSDLSDRDLMIALQNGDPTALEYLYNRYRALFHAVIVRVIRDHAAADDVLQDCLVEMWRSASHFSQSKGEPLSWLVTLCKRRAIDHTRRMSSYSRACDRFELEISQTPQEHDYGNGAENADLAEFIQQHLALLPENQREAVTLAFMKGMSQREVARVTNTPLGTVKTRLELGVTKLRNSLLKYHLTDK